MYDVVKDSANMGGGFPYVLNTVLETYDFILPGVRYPIARVLQATVNGTTQTRGMYLDVTALGKPEELAHVMGMEVYPNPASNGIQVTLNYKLQNTADLNITLVNMLGQEIAVLKNGNTSSGKQTQVIPVTNLAKGLYFVKLTTNGQVALKRLVIQ